MLVVALWTARPKSKKLLAEPLDLTHNMPYDKGRSIYTLERLQRAKLRV